jgi:hypothetical protein
LKLEQKNKLLLIKKLFLLSTQHEKNFVEKNRSSLKPAEEDHDLDMLDSTRPDRLRLHKHMDSWIVKRLKLPKKNTKKSFVDQKQTQKNCQNTFSFVHPHEKHEFLLSYIIFSLHISATHQKKTPDK